MYRLACHTRKQSDDTQMEIFLASVDNDFTSCFSVLAKGPNSHVNVTVIKMTVSSQRDQFCLSGGFVTYELRDRTVVAESNILCQNISQETRASRKFYSQGSTLSLVLFWYSQLIRINTLVSITHCKAVTIDLCFLSHCWTSINNLYTRECIPYLGPILQGLGVNFRFRRPHFSAAQNRPEVTLIVEKQNCLILQFKRHLKKLFEATQMGNEPTELCALTIRFQSSALQGNKGLMFEGSLSPVHSESQCLQSNEVVDPKQHKLTVVGFLEKLQLQSTRKVPQQIGPSRAALNLIPGCVATEFVGSFPMLSPAHFNDLMISLIFPKYSDNWVDLILRRTSSGLFDSIKYLKICAFHDQKGDSFISSGISLLCPEKDGFVIIFCFTGKSVCQICHQHTTVTVKKTQASLCLAM